MTPLGCSVNIAGDWIRAGYIDGVNKYQTSIKSVLLKAIK